MAPVSFTPRTFQVVPGPAGTRDVVLSTIVSADDARALSAALAWQRSRQYLAPEMESADQVLALRAMVGLLDELEVVAGTSHGGPMTLTEPRVVMLAEASSMYVAERDGAEGYQAPAERERLGHLRALGGPLFDVVADFAGARAEAREHHGLEA
jgi:hypothetical protein